MAFEEAVMKSSSKISLILCLAISLMAGVAWADVGVNWYNTTYMADDDTNNPADYDNEPAYGEMYWSTSSTPWTPEAGDVSTTDTVGMVHSTDQGPVYVLDTVFTTNGSYGRFGSSIAPVVVYSNGNVGGANINAGYIYAMLFDDTNLVGLLTQYHVSSVFNTASYVYDVGNPLSFIQLNQAGGAGPYPGDDYGYNLVPEPMSLSLYGLGMAVLVGLSRRRQRRS